MGMFLTGCHSSLSSNPVDTLNKTTSLHAICDAPLDRQITQLARDHFARQRSTALVIGVISRNQPPQIFSYGFTDSDKRVPVTGDTLFAVGSVTKGVTAEIAALQVQQNKLAWHTTLRELFPSEKDLSPDAQKITVEQLASHTAGLPRQAYNLPMLGKLVRYVFTGEPFYDDLDRGEYQDYLSTFHAPDNVQVNYSNLGYAILDSALETNASRTIPEMAQQSIFTPLKMMHTGYVPEKLPGYILRARGHAGDQPKFVARGEVVPEWRFSHDMVGAASMWSTGNDLLRYLEAHLSGTGNAQLDLAFADAMTLRRFQNDDDAAALGWLGYSAYGQTLLYQSGFIGGYSSYIGLDKRHGNAIVVLQNSFNWQNDIGHRLLLRMAVASDHPRICTAP
ncbi:Penicillin-binding protein, beta-lactamase class C [Pseudocitrobacter vendiensis]|uniref:Penicillin-binding protein, beta-lactamase class C n=2 Tax=Pseudocitrobacter vendiensis TaxID=2488306 RepID=A0ABM9FGG6_9ENTR|nr:Penicillin-binding protein, beta-lactamase class C [Pseudocitrobacter vendiensis]